MPDLTRGESVFPDVAFHRGSVWVCYREDPRVAGRLVVTRDGAEVLAVNLPAESPCFPRLHSWAGALWLGYHDGTRGHLQRLDVPSISLPLAPCDSNDPICFGYGWVAWQGAARDRWLISRIDLNTGEVVPAGYGAGTGLSRILADGTVRLIDEDRKAGPAGTTRPCWAGDLVVAETPDPQNRGVRWALAGGRTGVLWPDIPSTTPRCAVDGELVAVVTWGGQIDIRQWIGLTSELPGEPPVPQPPIPPEPVMPDSLKSAVEAERAKYPAVLTPDQPAKILNAVAWAHSGWGLSAKPIGNHVPSPQGVYVAYDVLHHKPSDTLWDCATGDLAFVVTWSQAPHHHDPDRPWVAPVDPGAVPEPGPTPQPPVDLESAIRRVLDGMRISLKTDNGHFLCAENGGGGEVNATRDAAAGWETFTVNVQG